MAALRPLEAPTGLRPGDHVCWTFSGRTELQAAVLPFLDEGRRRSERLLLVGEAGLVDVLDDLPERDVMLADGRLRIWATTESCHSAQKLEPRAQADVFRREVQAAVDQGRPGLRVAADVSALVDADPENRRRLHQFEQLADTLTGQSPLTGMCLYDAGLGEEALGPLAVLHPVQHLGDRLPLAHLSGRGPCLALHGEVDASVAEDVLPALVDLGRAAPGADVVLDLAELEFLDVPGARMLHLASEELAATGVRLRPVRPRRSVARCLELFALPYQGVSPA